MQGTAGMETGGERWATGLKCSRTGALGDLDRAAFLSPAGAPWLVEYELDPPRGEELRGRLAERPWTMWRYRELLPHRDHRGRIDLGAGGTPLIRVRRLAPPGIEVWIKQEAGNPTGSFKDRGLSMAVNRALELGAPGVQLASAGNAALATSAYAAAAGLPCRVAMPADTPTTVIAGCRRQGAEVLLSPGTLVDARRRLAESDTGLWDLSTLREPYRVEGKKTMGLEIAEQLGWTLPDWILYPTGGGTGIVGMWKAFAELRELALVNGPLPRMAVVQMEGCAPIVRAFERGEDSATPWPDPRTEVWGLRVPQALGDFLVLRALRESDGAAVAVTEEGLDAQAAALASREGILAGPEGAAAFAAVAQLAAAGRLTVGQRVVVFQTGHPANYGWGAWRS